MTTSAEQPYKMSISLNVLNHLGIGLYSNIPAVLSEVVANAWDADATRVTIIIDRDASEISIQDDGIGMTRYDINEKYLMVGYDRRAKQPGKTPKGRAPMGRKGIGKLSVFSIADTVEVYSARTGERNALRMSLPTIRDLIEGGATIDYVPIPLDSNLVDFQRGTKIVLRDLRRSTTTTEPFLRRRLARRFSVIGPKHGFHVVLDGEEISAKDRDFFDAIEFLWYLGEESSGFVDLCANVTKSMRVDNIVGNIETQRATGWIGTVDERKSIDDQNNSIVIYAHGKLIQEDILKDFAEGGVYSKYIIGEIDADFMDVDDQEDIVTSDRQRVKVDDPRYEALKTYIWGVLKGIQNKWTDLRTEVGEARALQTPAIAQWYSRLQGDNKKAAKRLFGKIESLKVPDINAKKELYKASLMAFEKLALTSALSVLEELETEEDFGLLAKIFADIDELEAAHYYQIVKGRLEIVREFVHILPNARERIIQKYIFDHLWLLDPSWERASSNLRIEQSVTKEFEGIGAKLSQEEKDGRIDIRYKTAAGKHIIIELKKYDRDVDVLVLLTQLRKYRDALETCLRERFPQDKGPIELICILGKPPLPRDREAENIGLLRQIDARFITYDTLIQETLKSYGDYLIEQQKVSELITLINRLDEEFAPLTQLHTELQ